jgi:uncharacterized lipoprotein YajG
VKRVIGLTAVLLLAGCALPPQGTGPDTLAAFDTAVESVGCNLIVEGDYLATELQTGMTREQVVQMIQYKLGLKQATRRPEGGFTFTSGACAA